MNENLKYQIALSLLPGVGPVLAKNLLAYCGSAEAIFKEKKGRLEKIPGLGPVTSGLIINHSLFKKAEEEVLFVEKNKISTHFYGDDNYPERLRSCTDSPILLYYKGNANLNHKKIIAVVGTRNATEYGKNMCEKIIEELVSSEVLVLSGLAYGIDIYAHRSALKFNIPTVAVLAHGLDKMYPSIHRNTARSMIENGGLLTEYTSGVIPDKENFPSRNRIVAGMCDALLIVESGIKGGSLISANIAHSYNRDVFAVPGRVGETYSSGCNFYIKTNKAALVESASDIVYQMGWGIKEEKSKDNSPQKKLFPELNEEEKNIFDFLEKSGKSEIDFISHELKLSMSKTSTLLLNLEFSGVIRSLPGKVYELI